MNVMTDTDGFSVSAMILADRALLEIVVGNLCTIFEVPSNVVLTDKMHPHRERN